MNILKQYLVGYIDVLGQKKILSGMCEIPDMSVKNEESARFLNSIRDSYGFIRAFRKSFDEFLQAFGSSTSTPHASESERVIWETKRTKIRTFYFSDTIVVFSPIVDPEIRCPSSGFFGILNSFASAFLLSLALGNKSCRGGIEIGLAMELEEGDLYGPALMKSYELESKVAEYPRIVIGSELLEYLSLSASTPSIGNLYEDTNREISRACIKLISKDSDNIAILDYLGEGYKELGADPKASKNVIQAGSFVKQELERFQKKGDTELAGQYGKLMKYFDRNISRWT